MEKCLSSKGLNNSLREFLYYAQITCEDIVSENRLFSFTNNLILNSIKAFSLLVSFSGNRGWSLHRCDHGQRRLQEEGNRWWVLEPPTLAASHWSIEENWVNTLFFVRIKIRTLPSLPLSPTPKNVKFSHNNRRT